MKLLKFLQLIIIIKICLSYLLYLLSPTRIHLHIRFNDSLDDQIIYFFIFFNITRLNFIFAKNCLYSMSMEHKHF